MIYMSLLWKPILECDDEEGNHTCWSAEVNHEKYGKFVWITMLADRYHVEYDNNGFFETLANCKSLSSAKKWVTSNMMYKNDEMLDLTQGKGGRK